MTNCGCDWTYTKKDRFHRVDKACEKLRPRDKRSVCVNCESKGERERWGKEATLRMLFQARSMEKRTWQLGFWASRPSRFNPTFSLLWVLFLFLPLCFLSFKYHFIISLLLCVVLGPHDVKVRIKAVGICGSDVHHFKVESSLQFSFAFYYRPS